MVRRSPQFFADKYLPTLSRVCSYLEVSRQLNFNNASTYVWLRQSREAAKRGDDPSDYFFEYEGEKRFFHDHCKSAITASISDIESNARMRARDGTFTVAKFQGQTVYKINPDWLDEDMRDLLSLGEGDKYLRDARGNMVPELVWSPPSTDLVLAILSSNSKKYARKSSVDVNMRGQIGGVLTLGGPKPPAIAAPLPLVEIIQSEAEPERVAVDEEQPADFAEIPDADELDFSVTDTAPNAPPVAPAEEDADPLPPTPPAPTFSTPTPPEYQPGPNVLIQPRNGRPLSDLERDLLSKLPASLTRK